MLQHEPYERLAAAVALGEATQGERATFDAHAVACADCRADSSDSLAIVALLSEARDGETWRPSVDDVVMGRIREARARRSAITVGALGWAVAASIVLNVAFASGFTTHLERALRDSGGSHGAVVATRWVARR